MLHQLAKQSLRLRLPGQVAKHGHGKAKFQHPGDVLVQCTILAVSIAALSRRQNGLWRASFTVARGTASFDVFTAPTAAHRGVCSVWRGLAWHARGQGGKAPLPPLQKNQTGKKLIC